VVEVDAVTGLVRAGGSTIEHYVGKVLDAAFLLIAGVEMAGCSSPARASRKSSFRGASRPARPNSLIDRHGVMVTGADSPIDRRAAEAMS